MKFFVVANKLNPNLSTVLRMVDFLQQRGHDIVYFQPLQKTATFNFEHKLELLKSCDRLIFEASFGDFDDGFLVSLATSKLIKKTLIIYNVTNADIVPEVIRGCTYPHVYIKPYNTWQDLQNILTLLQF